MKASGDRRKKVRAKSSDRRSPYSRAARAVKRIIDECGATMDVDDLTQLALFMVVLKLGKF